MVEDGKWIALLQHCWSKKEEKVRNKISTPSFKACNTQQGQWIAPWSLFARCGLSAASTFVCFVWNTLVNYFLPCRCALYQLMAGIIFAITMVTDTSLFAKNSGRREIQSSTNKNPEIGFQKRGRSWGDHVTKLSWILDTEIEPGPSLVGERNRWDFATIMGPMNMGLVRRDKTRY